MIVIVRREDVNVDHWTIIAVSFLAGCGLSASVLVPVSALLLWLWASAVREAQELRAGEGKRMAEALSAYEAAMGAMRNRLVVPSGLDPKDESKPLHPPVDADYLERVR